MRPVQRALDPGLTAVAFRRSGQTWRRAGEFGIEVVNLQSVHGTHVFINLGLYINGLGNDVEPREEQCHIRARLERVVPNEYFESVRSIEPESISADAVRALLDHGIPWLAGLCTSAGLAALLMSEQSKPIFIHRRVRSLHQMPPDKSLERARGG